VSGVPGDDAGGGRALIAAGGLASPWAGGRAGLGTGCGDWLEQATVEATFAPSGCQRRRWRYAPDIGNGALELLYTSIAAHDAAPASELLHAV
jgi:hypothetical protein